MTLIIQIKEMGADPLHSRHLRLIALTLAVLVALLAGCSRQPNVPDNFLARSVIVDGTEYQYRVFIPKNYDPNKKMPVMLFLHGSGARGEDNIA